MRDKLTPINVLIALVLALFGGAGISVVLLDDDGDGRTDGVIVKTKTVQAAPPAVAVDGPDADTKRDDALPLNEAAQDSLEDAAALPDDKGELGGTLREPDDGKAGVLEGPLAAQEFPGCRTRFVRNFSSRNGAKVRVIVWHYTVSRERGQASQDGLTAYANSPSSGVSWHFLIGRSKGLCTFTVPLNYKAWTQGNANPFSVGIEVEAQGDEGTYVTGAGERKLLSVTRGLGKRYGIPMRRGLVRNCQPVRSGIVTHAELGACGGGHKDIGPFKDAPRLIAKLTPKPVTRTDRTTCRKLNYWRRHGRPAGKARANAVRRRKALESRGVTCTARGPVRA